MALSLCKHSSALCGHDPECPDLGCEGRPSFPLHRQVMPPESTEQEGHTLGLWLVYGVSLAIFLSFVLMTWVVYPNFPQ